MADILKITTPLVNKSQMIDPQKGIDPTQQFDLHNISKVTKPGGQEAILQQNNGLNQQETSAMLLNLLKDPSVAAGSLKNIYMMEELIKLLPINNKTLTQEIQQMFNQLLIDPEQIADEMMRQQSTSTSFRGEMFDFLRQMLSDRPAQDGLRSAVMYFLKAYNSHATRESMLNSVANSLDYLADSLSSSKSLQKLLMDLSGRFRASDAVKNFDSLKKDLLYTFKEIENSILYSPKLAKVVSIATYNLSRFNDNERFFQEATTRLLAQLHGEETRATFLNYVEQYYGKTLQRPERSVVDVLAKLIDKQAGTEEIMLMNSEKVETIIRSLLSSPCNFTPLLHFVIPVQYEDIQSFAEIWVNHSGEEDREGGSSGEHAIHMLLVFEINDIGRFELELYVRDKLVDLSLFCPPPYTEQFSKITTNVSKSLRALDYKLGEVHIEKLERARSLMDVFRSLPYKRTGIDVQI